MYMFAIYFWAKYRNFTKKNDQRLTIGLLHANETDEHKDIWLLLSSNVLWHYREHGTCCIFVISFCDWNQASSFINYFATMVPISNICHLLLLVPIIPQQHYIYKLYSFMWVGFKFHSNLTSLQSPR